MIAEKTDLLSHAFSGPPEEITGAFGYKLGAVFEPWPALSRDKVSITSDNFGHIDSNMFTAKLHKEALEHYRGWNEKAHEARSLAIPLAKERMEPIEREHNLSPDLGLLVQAQIVMVLMEAEFAHLIGPGNFPKLAFWFLNGHIPCGWKGEFPNGNLVIF